VIAQRIFALLDAAKTDLMNDNALVFYGDQNRVPVTPALCVESGETGRALGGVPNRVENTHTCYIILYHSPVDETQTSKLQSEQYAEAVTAFLDTNLTLDLDGDGGIVIHGFVRNIEPGYSYKNKGNTLMNSVRLTWQGTTKTILGA
jgi:hypothetical protein